MPTWIVMAIIAIILFAIALTMRSIIRKGMFLFIAGVLTVITLMCAVNDPFFWGVVTVIAVVLIVHAVLKRRKKAQKEQEEKDRRNGIRH